MLDRLISWLKQKLEHRKEMTMVQILAKSNGKISRIPKFRTFPARWE